MFGTTVSTDAPGYVQGLKPEIYASDFAEDLSHGSFDNLYEYPTATATEKAITVYKKLVVRLQTSNLLFSPTLPRKTTRRTLQTSS